MKLTKIYEKIKKYLSFKNDEEIEKKKFKKLNEKIEDKISQIKKKIKHKNNLNDKKRLKDEVGVLKKFKKQLKTKIKHK